MKYKRTSREAYNKLVESGKGAKQKAVVLNAVINAHLGATRQELCSELDIPINSIYGRVNELITSKEIRVGKYPVRCRITKNMVEVLWPVLRDDAR